MRRVWAGLVASIAVLAGLVVPAASATPTATPAATVPAGPVPLGSVPCPSVVLASTGRSVLATVAPDTSIPTSLLAAYGATRYPGVPQTGLVPFAVRGSVPAFMTAVAALPGVRAVQLDRVVEAAKTRTPRDPYLSRQWSLAKIHATTAWGVEIGATRTIPVAVLDTGVDATHPDLSGRVLSGFDFYDGDADPSDEQYHGTAVASVIAANTDNRIGMSGVSWGAQIVPVRVLGPDGSGTECTIAAGIVYAASETYIANMSFGAPGPCSVAMQEAVDFAVQSPTLLIAAAGNDARSHNPSMEPANCQGVVGVGATDERDHVAAFSEHGSQVMFTAPGVRVLAAYRTPQGGHTYGYLSGTSLAAPMVSGVAALLYSRYATWGTADVIARLRATAFDLGKKGRDPYYGYGRIDAGRALTAH